MNSWLLAVEDLVRLLVMCASQAASLYAHLGVEKLLECNGPPWDKRCTINEPAFVQGHSLPLKNPVYVSAQ